MAQVVLRRAVVADAGSVAALMRAAYAEHVARLGDSLPVGGDYGDEIARYPVWIAEMSGQVVGALVLQPQQDHMLLANVAVLPDQQGKGVGRALFEKADAEARAQGHSEMRLFTHQGMTDTIALYERLGWQQVASESHGVRVAMRKRVD